MITSKQYCDRLKYMAMKRKSKYLNKFPYNCCYIYSDGSISADCIGLVKSLINNPNVYNKTSPAGYYVTPGTTIPDTNELGILNLCSSVSSDFSRLVPGEYLYMSGHGGIYVGEFNDGGLCNVVECTMGWGANGITTSYVDNKGRRFNHKGGTQIYSWEKHGKLYRYITYEDVYEWKKSNGKWYLYKNGEMVKGWARLDDKWYYLDTDGAMVTGWKQIKWSRGTDWFYFNDKGVMLTGWQKLKWSKGTDWFYFDTNGAMLTGWQKLRWSKGVDWFYFYTSGAMAMGTITIDDKEYTFDKNGSLVD